MLPKGEVTLVYTSSPPTEAKPRKDKTILRKGSEDVLNYKREIAPRKNETLPGGNILANYVLFNQGVFAAYIGMFFFFTILFVGLKSITSLKVTYGGKLNIPRTWNVVNLVLQLSRSHLMISRRRSNSKRVFSPLAILSLSAHY
jgi:hypothetical protein